MTQNRDSKFMFRRSHEHTGTACTRGARRQQTGTRKCQCHNNLVNRMHQPTFPAMYLQHEYGMVATVFQAITLGLKCNLLHVPQQHGLGVGNRLGGPDGGLLGSLAVWTLVAGNGVRGNAVGPLERK